MIKKIACASAVVAALLAAAAPAAEAAPKPVPANGVPAAPLLNGILGSLEVGHPVTSLKTIVPTGVRGE
ncbi:hypothetical protein ABT272_07410 [Streptomyces sp900105245]|uniref:Secreted protein n=1 Tax=Streptomyces sp. 900105245 TaxID=3154379 RepID=A0ABV1U1F3_9ACTN